ncbi:nucleotide exchange factor GrpE [Candidatus Carsonella ruddii]|uniref:nucleotide exchange factor GrpE n=1 Tax=Carsonella ruddii TaxID=114186 RepID=UPI003D4CAFF7
MKKEFSLLNFLEKVTFLEEKFTNFLLESKKINKYNKEEFNYIKDLLINDIINELIPITDALEVFAKNFNKNQVNEIEILVLIFKLIKNFFLKFNIKQISKIGNYFNPEIHEAIGMYSNTDKKGTIKKVLQTGYIKNNILIRPALVIVYN